MRKATLEALKNYAAKKLTYDNWLENAMHEDINKALGRKSLFLQQFLLQRTNFDLISDEETDKIPNITNSRPMKTLG